MSKELRTLSTTELRADNDSRLIDGYAIRFNEWSRDLGGFVELIKPESITQELVDNSDIIFNLNHNDEKMVARWNKGKGTLSLELRNDGLYFAFNAPTTELGNQLLYDVRNGNLFECSFAFTVDSNNPDSELWYRNEDNKLCREINIINGLYDCSIVNHAAYPTTSVSARGEEVVLKSQEVDKAMNAILDEIKEM